MVEGALQPLCRGRHGGGLRQAGHRLRGLGRYEPASYTTPASAGGAGGGPGQITDMSGRADPANYRGLNERAKTGLARISGAFGEPLRMTPHGGASARASKTSQHMHGNAGDIYIEDMDM